MVVIISLLLITLLIKGAPVLVYKGMQLSLLLHNIARVHARGFSFFSARYKFEA